MEALRTIKILNSRGNCELPEFYQSSVESNGFVTDSSNAFAIEAIVERLVQRLMRSAGNLDRRFSSMFLVSLNEPRRIKVKGRRDRNFWNCNHNVKLRSW